MLTASDILGVPVPSDAPSFLLPLGAHIAGGITGVISGAIAAFARKHQGLHTRAGLIYWVSLAWVFLSSVAMSILRWPHDVHLLVIGVLSFGLASAGFLIRFKGGPNWQRAHLVMMGGSYIALLTGFYVDNGPHLPLWRSLPPFVFWILPAAIGVPIIFRASRTVSRSPSKDV